MTTNDAKAYLAKREIPQLFESLMTGLMYYRPDDHITYLQDCLHKVQDQGVDTVRWNLFIEQRRKTPLPPINANGRTPTPGALERDTSFITETQAQQPRDLDDKGVPLPPISDDRKYGQTTPSRGTRVPPRADRATPGAPPPAALLQDRVADSERRAPGMPNCPIVLVMGGPGSGRATQCTRLIDRYNGWVHLSVGDLLRDQIFSSGSADAKWDAVGTLIKRGEMAPEDVTMELLKGSLAKHMNATGIILEGFPRTLEQVAQLDSVIGSVDLVFVLDCEESYLQQRLLQRGQQTERLDDNMKAIANRIIFFKEKTLPVIKHFDDVDKVVIIDGDRDVDEIFYDLSLLFDHTFYSGYGGDAQVGGPTSPTPRPPSAPKPRSPRPGSTRYSRPNSRAARPGSGFANVPRILEMETSDTGRKQDLPDCHIMLVLGGPGVNRLAVAKKMAQKHEGAVVISTGQLLINNMASAISGGRMASDEDALKMIVSAIKDNADAKGFILEGYPRNKVQVEALNTHVGGITGVILLDSEHDFMEKQLLNKGVEAKDIERRIAYYKYNTLPIIAHYDDLRKLIVINAEQDESDLFKDLGTELRALMHGQDGDATEAASPRASSPKAPSPTRDAPSPTRDSASPTRDVSSPTRDVSSPTRDTSSPTRDAPSPARDSSSPTNAEPSPFVVTRLEISVPDRGRKPGGPQCCVVAIVGSPGSGVDTQCSKIVEKFPGFVHVKDVAGAQNHADAKAIILEDYPANQTDIEEFNEKFGGINRVIVLDCEEDYAKENAGSRLEELEAYKTNTLPAMAHFEDHQKLEFVDIQRNTDEVFDDLCKAIENAVEKHNSAVVVAPSDDFKLIVTKLDVKVEDKGRQEGLADVPIISIIGNTGSHCSKLVENKPGVVHLKDVSVGEIEAAMKASSDSKGFILENFPRNQEEFEEFNSKVGGMTGVIMMDASERYLVEQGVDLDKLRLMQQNTFPVIAHYEDRGKLEYVDSEKDEQTTSEALSRALSLLLAAGASS